MANNDLNQDIRVDKDYFYLTIPDLDPGEIYPMQFIWKKEDGSSSDWSATKVFTVPGKSTLPVPKITSSDVELSNGVVKVRWGGKDTSNNNIDMPKISHIGIYITDEDDTFGEVEAGSFKSAGSKTLPLLTGTYTLSLACVSSDGGIGPKSTGIPIEMVNGETIEAPTNPNGFTLTRILSGLELKWAGTYANGTFKGFKAIKVYVGNSATATAGTYVEAGVLTGDQLVNKIVIPEDGTYCRYSQPVYIHVRAINKNDVEGTLQVNVAHDDLGARSAVSDDLANNIISNVKLVDGAISEAKIATGAITGTKIADGSITSPKIIANAITADKIVSGAIIADKIATNAITATKIEAGAIEVEKLGATVLTVNNLKAGNINSTSYIRAGTADSARIEISSSAVSGTNVLAGLHIYSSQNTAILKAPLTGGLEITGKITATSGAITGDMTIGNIIFKGANTDGFLIEDTDGFDVIYAPSSGGRITLGHSVEGQGRQVDVARSAQIAGNSQGSGAENSGGLRNMYTATVANFADYPDAYLDHRPYSNGDVLLVWTP
jgi:hypothetical protein